MTNMREGLVVRPLQTRYPILYSGKSERLCAEGAKGLIFENASEYERRKVRRQLEETRSIDRWAMSAWQFSHSPTTDEHGDKVHVLTYDFHVIGFELQDLEALAGTFPTRTVFFTVNRGRFTIGEKACLRGINYRLHPMEDDDYYEKEKMMIAAEDQAAPLIEFRLKYG